MKTNVIVLMGMLLSLSLTSCKPDDEVLILFSVDQSVFLGEINRDCSLPPATRTDAIWNLDGFKLYHTRGLDIMALTGSVSLLQGEYCEIPQIGGSIPSGLGDDPFNQSYASRITFGDWVVAMYHPSNLHGADHWIMYRKSDQYWERWDLGQRSQTAQPEDGIPYLWTKKQGTNVIQTNN